MSAAIDPDRRKSVIASWTMILIIILWWVGERAAWEAHPIGILRMKVIFCHAAVQLVAVRPEIRIAVDVVHTANRVLNEPRQRGTLRSWA